MGDRIDHLAPIGEGASARKPTSPPSSAVLEGRGLGLRFGMTLALHDASIAIGAGESVAVVGPSGSGKSSLLHCLGAVLRPTEGEVWLDGQRIDALSDEELSRLRRERFGFVFQFAELLPELSLAENVALPLRLAGVRRRLAEQQAIELLDALGIGGLADRRPSDVSGGQLQRAAIARSLVHRPGVVLADEPTGALDTATGAQVLDLLLDADVRRGASVLVVTHDDRVADRCNRIVPVVDGTVRVDRPLPSVRAPIR